MQPLSITTKQILINCTEEVTSTIKELTKSLRNLDQINKKEKEFNNKIEIKSK